MHRTALSLAAASLVACNVSTLPSRPPPADQEAPEHAGRDSRAVRSATRDDAPEISRSVGEAGGVVVLWPRVVPRSDDPELAALAGAVQARLEKVARKVAGGDVDKRPAPERVCPREGCKAASLGAVLTKNGEGCTVVALVAAPGASPTERVAWFGGVKLASPTVPFREPPETGITVVEHGLCADLSKALQSNAPPADEAGLEAALQRAVGAER